MKKTRLTLLLIMTAMALIAAACGGNATEAPAAAQPTTPAAAQPAPQMPAADQPTVEAPDAAAAASECEEFFGFCATVEISGALTGAGSGGFGSSFDNDCTAWAAGGDARILELPLMLAAGNDKITVALSRVGAYTGPGTYELAAVATGGAMPDMFPAIEVAGRSFSNGEGSTATVMVNADGSGLLQATGLVEIASVQVSSPDPDARIDLSMQWTCQEGS
ncbi:MAG TPA: hypothetical protein VL334_08495 [Anaerolineae bacterium]|nr:hypothetical protein [Anaerolineae bacterium]